MSFSRMFRRIRISNVTIDTMIGLVRSKYDSVKWTWVEGHHLRQIWNQSHQETVSIWARRSPHNKTVSNTEGLSHNYLRVKALLRWISGNQVSKSTRISIWKTIGLAQASTISREKRAYDKREMHLKAHSQDPSIPQLNSQREVCPSSAILTRTVKSI